jgi:DNA mismatch repair ATPase MutS
MEMFFMGFALLVFVASIWSQITAAVHLRAIWFDVVERGQVILNAIGTAKRTLERLNGFKDKPKRAVRQLIEEGEAVLEACAPYANYDGGAAYGAVWNDPEPLLKVRDWLSLVDVFATLSDQPDVCFPLTSKETVLTIRGVHHPAVPNCIRNDYDSRGNKEPHTLLTGPNRGGKSTFCKSIGLAIVTAQTWGFAYAESMTWSPFAVVLTALEPCGKLGYCSTFEAEIEFAKSVLQTKGVPAFVMMDEIFHSTNAHDGVAASRVFLSQLYEKSDTISIVSTHYAELTTIFDKKVSAKQLVASQTKDGALVYTYNVGPGVSSLSSVMEILEERGLRVKESDRGNPATEKLPPSSE